MEPDNSMEDGIAIIGMAGRFPGAKNIHEFWRNLRNGVESITFYTDEELDASGIDPLSLRNNPNYVGAGAVLEDAEYFDAAFFGFNPKEAEIMDPQHRVFLESAWEALENAGYDAKSYAGSIGVYAGAGANSYLLSNIYPNRELRDLLGLPIVIGNGNDFLPTRVSYKLDLKGPSVNVQTACSTSLVAVCAACQSLLSYQCDMALAGGVAIAFPQKQGYLYQEGGILSADGHCRAFDAKASGMVFGRGVGIVVLKRLADARADGDSIYAVIKGSATNNDGSLKVGYTAPSVDGQAEVIAMAQAVAGIDAGTISYIETHGTGTPMGDPVEIAGLTQAFRASTAANNFCAIGSVKTNVGHLDIASGVTGLIKTALALKYKQLPPSLHFEEPNPKIDFANSPFYVNTELREWKAGKTPRRAGVSSFGIGGTNAHVVLEEAPADTPSGPSRPWQLLTLSAKTGTALEAATSNLAAHLINNPDLNLADAAYTLHLGRSDFKHRRMLVCRDAGDALNILDKTDTQRLVSHVAGREDAPIVFMFPGQGAQFINMGRDVYQAEPEFKKHVDYCAEFLRQYLGLDLRDILFPSEEQTEAARQQLGQTSITQPALFVIEYALSKLWMAWGVNPQAMIGHSIGEYVAACLAGVFSLDDALTLVAARGRLMQEQTPGAMLAVRLPEKDVLALLSDGLSLAAVNGAALCVISGPTDTVEKLQESLTAQDIAHRRLHTSHAFHSAMMDPMLKAFQQQLEKVEFRPTRIPFISNVSGNWITDAEAGDVNYWVKHLRHTVRFSAGLETLCADKERIFLEVGPGQTLTTLARQHPAKAAEQIVVPSSHGVQEQESDIASLLNAVGRLWAAGIRIDWKQFYAQEQRRRIALPAYPFERKRYWLEAPRIDGSQSRNETRLNLIQIPQTNQKISSTDKSEKEFTMIEQHTAAPPILNRQERLEPLLKNLLSDLSGMDLASVSNSTTFLEMGFDSLFLTQVSQALQKKFGIKVTFRQLLQDAPTLTTLAAFIDQKLPADAFRESVSPPKAAPEQSYPAPASAPSLEPTLQALMDKLGQHAPMYKAAAEPASAGVMERIMSQQLVIMAQQLEELRQSRITASPADQPQSAMPSPGGRKVEAVKQEVKAFGPYKPIQKGNAGGLTGQQQKHLDALIERYTQRTAESKRLTQMHRAHLSDPRAVAGFRQLWKEMVYPIVSEGSRGSRIFDVDGNEYIDVTMGFGVNLFGHSPAFVTRAIEDQLKHGVEIGPTSPLAGKVAALMCEFTGMERTIFCNTGSEAVTAALRAARTVTGRDKIALFAGSYHGIFDEVLVRTKTVNGQVQPASIAPGIPDHMVQDVIVLEYGAPEALEILKARGHEIAALLVEPVQSRRPDFQPKEFLHEVRRITQECGTALVFDEVITGFRVAPGGAQAWFGVQADLATYGKVVGGGLPIGVMCGKAEYLNTFDGGAWNYGDDSFPEVGVTFFAGTFVRHPLALAAAWAVLNHLKENGPQLQQTLNQKTAEFAGALNSYFTQHQMPVRLTQFSSFFYVNFEGDPQFAGLLSFHMREKGIHIWDGRPCFLSTAHTDEDIAAITRAFKESVAELQAGGFIPGSSAPQGIKTLPVQAGIQTQGSAAEANTLAGERKILTKDMADSATNTQGLLTLPLTEPQNELWMAANMTADASCSFNDSVSIHLRGPLNRGALQQALQEVVNRHDAFRTSFSPDGDYQHIVPDVKLEVPLIDFSGLSEREREVKTAEIIDQDIQKSFDLERAPLLRVRLLRLGEEAHLLVLITHHIVCDGWSVGVILHELSVLYTALCEKLPHALGEAMQFSEYIDWQAREQQSPDSKDAENYWSAQFANPPPALELPIDRPRPPTFTYLGARKVLTIGEPLYGKLQGLGKQQSATLFTLLLAAFEVWLHRLTNQEDIVVGIPAAGQALAGGHNLVGHCVNFLPLRKQVDKNARFTDFLNGLKGTVLDAYDHQNYTFGSLVQKLNLPRDPSRTPLVSVTFNIDRMKSELSFPGLAAEVFPNSKSFINFDIKLNIVETDDELKMEWYYNTSLFDEASILRLASHYETLLAGIVADPAQQLADLPLLSAVERERLLVDWNATAVPYPAQTGIHTLFEAQVEQDAEAVALVFEGASLSYGELNKQANQLARHLQKLGLGAEMPVGLCVERSFEMMIALLAILKAGGAYVPLDPAYPQARLDYLIADTRTPLILTQTHLAGQLPQQAEILCLENLDLSAYATDNLGVETGAQDLAYVMYTSGSTGQPKGVCVPHQAVVRLVKNTRYAHFSRDEIFLHMAPLAFDASTFEIWGALLNGARLVIYPAHLPSLDELGQLLQSERITTLWLTAGLFHQMVDERLEDLGQVRQLLAGGDVLSVSHVRKVLENLPDCTLINGYGPTENTTFSCCHAMRAPYVPGATVPIGRPIANSQAYILDTQLQPVPIGVTGELYLGGDGLARSYLNQERLTAEKFIPHPFSDAPNARLYRSGDLARYLPDGEIEFLGRKDQQVKLRGFRIELGEIEAALAQHPLVREAVVTVREDSPGDKRLAAYLVPVSKVVPETTAIRDYLKTQLPEYMVPAAFVVLPKLPLTANGKVDRKALPAPDTGTETARPYAPPRDDLEFQLTKLWEKALARSHIGIKDNFFEHGGHSLSAVRLVANIKKTFGIALPLASLFQAPTIEQLAVSLRQQGWKHDWTALVALQPAGDKPPFFCLPGGGGNLFGMRQLVRHMGEDQPFYGLQPPALSKGQALSSVEAMAAYYLREIRTLQPEGPYYLGGGCFGGLVALEMAQQLKAQGQEVALLVLIDTPPSPEPSVATATPWSNVNMHRENLALLGWRDKWFYLAERIRRKLTLGIKRLACKLFLKGGRLPAALREQYVFDSDVQAQRQYVARPYQGHLTLLWASMDIAQRYQDSYRVAWERLALGGIESYDLPCDHIGIFREPQVRILAERLKECIDKASRASARQSESQTAVRPAQVARISLVR